MRNAVFILGAAVVGLGVAAAIPTRAVVASSGAKERGTELFATRGCAHCHGTNGVGGGIGPDLQLVRQRMDAKQMATQIHDGGKEMPSYADQLSSEEMDDLVAFLRAKRKLVKVAKKPETPAAVPKVDDGPGM